MKSSKALCCDAAVAEEEFELTEGGEGDGKAFPFCKSEVGGVSLRRRGGIGGLVLSGGDFGLLSGGCGSFEEVGLLNAARKLWF